MISEVSKKRESWRDRRRLTLCAQVVAASLAETACTTVDTSLDGDALADLVIRYALSNSGLKGKKVGQLPRGAGKNPFATTHDDSSGFVAEAHGSSVGEARSAALSLPEMLPVARLRAASGERDPLTGGRILHCGRGCSSGDRSRRGQ